MRIAGILAAGSIAMLPLSAGAQVALYGVQPPPGSAFVRIVNASAAPLLAEADFTPPRTLGTAIGDRVGPYAVVDHAAGRTLSITAQQGEASLQDRIHAIPGSYETILISVGAQGLAASPVVDQTTFDQARVRLAFYNATSGCDRGKLVLQPKGIRVFADVAPGASAMRTTNPVQATLQATCAGQQPQDVTLDGLKAGNSYSIWLMLPQGRPLAFVTQDITMPYTP